MKDSNESVIFSESNIHLAAVSLKSLTDMLKYKDSVMELFALRLTALIIILKQQNPLFVQMEPEFEFKLD